jgi:hypothetical protein
VPLKTSQDMEVYGRTRSDSFGYVSWMRCYPDVGVSIAVQVNSSDDSSFGGRIADVLTRVAVALRERMVAVRER